MASDQQPRDVWTSPICLDPALPPVRLALTGDAASPFVELAHGSRHARLLAVDVVDPLGAGLGAIRPAAIKLQLDRPPAVAVDAFGAAVDNAAIAGGLAAAATGCGGLAGRVPPLSWCRLRDRFLLHFCPETLLPLRTCRDDALLERLGLERFSDSLHRYETAVSSAEVRRFYTWSRDSGLAAKPDVVVRRRSELIRDYAAVCRRSLTEDQQNQLRPLFPCWDCPQREECYSATDPQQPVVAEERLLPVTYHEAHVQLLPGASLPWESACKVLGGVGLAAALAADPVECAAAGSFPSWHANLLAKSAGARPWLTPGAAGAAGAECQLSPAVAAQLAREIAVIKLRVFQQLCSQLAAYHSVLRRPHFDLSSRSLRLRFAVTDSPMMPWRWTAVPILWQADFAPTLRVGLGLPTPSRVELAQHEDVVQGAVDVPSPYSGSRMDLVVPPPGVDPLQLSPLVDASAFRGAAQGRFRIVSDGARPHVEFVSQHARFQKVLPGDVAHLVAAGDLLDAFPGGLIGLVAEVKVGWLRIELGQRCAEQLRSLPVAGDAAADLVTYQNYNTACDLWPLGALLANLLVGGDRFDALAMDDLLRGLCRRLEERTGAVVGSVVSLARSSIQQTKELDSRSLLASSELRHNLIRPPLPMELWTDLWLLVLRMTSNIPGFSFATNHSEVAPMEEILNTIQSLVQRLEVEAFGADTRRAELAELVGQQLAAMEPAN